MFLILKCHFDILIMFFLVFSPSVSYERIGNTEFLGFDFKQEFVRVTEQL